MISSITIVLGAAFTPPRMVIHIVEVGLDS